MTKFWKVRIAMFIWGAACTYFWTRQIDLTSKVFISQVIGNSLILWWGMNEKSTYFSTAREKGKSYLKRWTDYFRKVYAEEVELCNSRYTESTHKGNKINDDIQTTTK